MKAAQKQSTAWRGNEVSGTELIREVDGSVVAEEASLTGEEESGLTKPGRLSRRHLTRESQSEINGSKIERGAETKFDNEEDMKKVREQEGEEVPRDMDGTARSEKLETDGDSSKSGGEDSDGSSLDEATKGVVEKGVSSETMEVVEMTAHQNIEGNMGNESGSGPQMRNKGGGAPGRMS